MNLRIVLCLILVQLFVIELTAQNFNYNEYWREVYKLEMKGLNKSALQKTDTIYTQAVNDGNEKEKLRATIYQSKYALLLEEDAQENVLQSLSERSDNAEHPFKSIYYFLKANSLFEYYRANNYQIGQRKIEETDTSDFNYWGKSRFLEEIHAAFSQALKVDKNFRLDDQSIRLLFEKDSSTYFQHLTLADWIATKAVEFYFFQSFQDPIQWGNEELVWGWEDFALQNFSNDSTYSRKHGLFILQQMGRRARESGSKELITFWELHRLKTLSNLNLKNRDINLVEAYRHLLDNQDILQSPLKLAFALKLHSISSDYFYQHSGHFKNAKAEAHQLATDIINSGEKNHEVSQAKLLIELIEQPSIDGQIQSFIQPETYSRVLVSYANLEEVDIMIYKPSAQQWLSLNKTYANPDMSEALDKREPVKSWKQKLPQPEDFNIHSTELLIEPLPKGQYTLAFYSTEKPKELLGFVHFQVSDLLLVDLGNDAFNHFALTNRDNGEAISGAKIQFFNGNSTFRVTDLFLHTFTSDSNGRFYVKSKDSQYGLGVMVIDQSDTTYFHGIHLSNNRWSSNENEEDLYDVQANVFTDRAIYRPGQTALFKGILSKSKSAEKSVVSNEEVLVTIYDANYSEIYEKYLKTNEFGTFSDSLKLPKDILTGDFEIEVEEGDAPSVFYEEQVDEFDGYGYSFRVENYKRPRFELEFDRIDSAFTLGDSVTITGIARSLAGNNLSNASIKYTVIQNGYRVQDNMESDFYWRTNWVEDEQIVVSEEGQLDSNGTFEIIFPTQRNENIDQEQLPVYEYQVEVAVTDINGETRELSEQIKVGIHMANSSVFAQPNVFKHEKALTVNVSSKNLNGEAFKDSGTLKVYRLEAESYLFNRTWPAPDLPLITEEEFQRHFPYEPYAENSTEPSEILVYETEVGKGQTEVELKGIAQWQVGTYLIRFYPDRTLAQPATTSFTLKESTDQVLSPQFISVLSDKNSYGVGETAKLTVSSNLKDLTVFLQPKRRNGQNTEYIFRLNGRTETLAIPIEQEDLGGFEIHYLAIGANHSETGSLSIAVPQPKAVLAIETKTFRSLLEPGAEEKWSFNIKGVNGKAAEAEVLASMYDASLDQFASNDWGFNPFSQQMFNSYNSYTTFPSFNNSSVINVIPFFSPELKERSLPTFQSFGYSFVNVRRAHSEYLNNLLSSLDAQIVGSRKKYLDKGEISGIIKDELGTPLPSVSIINSNGNSTATDRSGAFNLNASEGDKIGLRYLSYKAVIFEVGKDNFYEIFLFPDFTNLGEIIVTGNVEERKSQSHSISIIEVEDDGALLSIEFEEVANEAMPDVLRGQVAGISWTPSNAALNLRGATSLNGSNQPLIVVDGVITTLDQVSENDIASISQLNDATATSLYGARAANGVIIISTKAGVAKEKELLANIRTRTDFRETAFFFPHLRTDKNGNTNFSFSTPESLTRWKFQMLAHTKNLAYKQLISTVQTSKTLMVAPNMPRFIRAGDTLVVSAKVVNTSENPVQTSARLNLTNPENEEELGLLLPESKLVQRQLVGAKNSVEVFWSIVVPENINAIQYKVVATGAGFSDGEENYLPVLPKKVLVTESLPLWVAADTVQSFQLPALLNKKEGITDVSLKLELTKNPVWNALQSLPYLIEFPYECSEQTFARIFANALGANC